MLNVLRPIRFLMSAEYEPRWFNLETKWGDDKDVVKAGIALRCYFTAEEFELAWSSARSMNYRCKTKACPGRILFSLRKDQGWLISDTKDHNETCTTERQTPQYFEQRWNVRETLIPRRVLAGLAVAHMEQQSSIDKLPSTKDVKAFLLGHSSLLPPRWNAFPRGASWLSTLSSTISGLISENKYTPLSGGQLVAHLAQINKSAGCELDNLSAFGKKIKAFDADNDLRIITDAENRYVAAYLVLGPVKRYAAHRYSSMQFDIDGSHFKHPCKAMACKGLLRAVVHLDATGAILPVIIGHETREESEESWTDCLAIFSALFPEDRRQAIGLGCDRDRGSIAAVDSIADISLVYCYAHIKRNIEAKFKNDDNALALFKGIALAPSVQTAEALLGKLNSEHPQLAAYLAEIPKSRFIATMYPDARFSFNRTTNAVESYWSELGQDKIRESKTVTALFVRCYNKAIKKLSRMEIDSAAYRVPLTAYAIRQIENSMGSADKLSVLRAVDMSGVVVGDESTMYHCNIQYRQCTCQTRERQPIVCAHLLKLASHLNLLRAPLLLVDDCFVHRNWLECLSASKPLCPFVPIFSDDERTNDFNNPVYGRTKGRPPKEKEQRPRRPISRSAIGSIAKALGLSADVQLDLRSREEIFGRQAYGEVAALGGLDFPTPVTHSDMRSLLPGEYLVENILQYVLEKACTRSDFFCQHTFTLPLEETGSGCRPGFNLHHSVVFMPVHEQSRAHWVLYVIYPRLKQVFLLDSVAHHSHARLAQLRSYLKKWFAHTRWQFTTPIVPQQTNDFDCGIYVCAFAAIVASSPVPESRIKVSSKAHFFSTDQEAEITARVPDERQRIWQELVAAAKPIPVSQVIGVDETDIQILATPPSSESTSARSDGKKSKMLPRKARPESNKRIRSRGE